MSVIGMEKCVLCFYFVWVNTLDHLVKSTLIFPEGIAIDEDGFFYVTKQTTTKCPCILNIHKSVPYFYLFTFIQLVIMD